MAIVGAHVSAAGGVYHAIERGMALGGRAIQIFGASPRQWAAPPIAAASVQLFLEAWKKSSISHVFLHASYLINLAAANQELFQKSISCLSSHLAIANQLHANGLIFHIGSITGGLSHEEGLEQIVKGMKLVLQSVTGKALLIMENGSGDGKKIGSLPGDIGTLLRAVKSPRVRVCLDTAHAFTSGHFDLDEWDKVMGLEHVVAVHANDSKAEFASKRDRHENIGEGKIGIEKLKSWGKNHYLSKLPWLLEVPGFDEMGPDKRNVDILRKAVEGAGISI